MVHVYTCTIIYIYICCIKLKKKFPETTNQNYLHIFLQTRVLSYTGTCIVTNYNCHKLLLLIVHYRYYLLNAQVKLQVQTAVSRNLEALRNREVWLLNQVELLQSAKDEVLSRQQAKLHKLLGFIQTQKGGTTLTR